MYLTVSPSKQLDPQIPGHRRPQHARDDLPLAKSEAVGIDGGALAGAAGNVVEGLGRHGLLGLLPQLVGVRRDGRLDAAEYALRVDLQLVLPVAWRAAVVVPETHGFQMIQMKCSSGVSLMIAMLDYSGEPTIIWYLVYEYLMQSPEDGM